MLPDLSEITKWDLDQIKKLVNEMLSDPVQYEAELRRFNWWLGLAQNIADRALEDNQPNRKDWAHLALNIYEYLAEKDQSESTQIGLMLFRARFIVEYEAEVDGKIGSSREIAQWFLDDLTMSPESVQTEVPFSPEKLTRMDISHVRHLRKIKNRLRVLKYLRDNNKLERNKAIDEWLSLREKLP